jgi:RNA polymerase sigma-70 factor (family 1)
LKTSFQERVATITVFREAETGVHPFSVDCFFLSLDNVNVNESPMTARHMFDHNLLAQIAVGDEHAFRILFNTHSSRVYGYALKLTRAQDLAEEIVQDVFMKIWINRFSICEIQNIEAYLIALTRNHTFNALKRIAIEEAAKARLSRKLEQAHHATEEAVNFRESQNILNKALDRLPPQQRIVYSLCREEGLKYEEVAQRLNISRLTVKTHMQQALRTLKSHFTGFATVILLVLASSLS